MSLVALSRKQGLVRVLVCLLLLSSPILLLPGHTRAAEPPDLYARLIFIRDLQHMLTDAESKGLAAYRRGKLLNVRTTAEEILARNPNSMVAHYLMAYTLRYAEGNLIRALRHLRRSMSLYKQQVGRIPAFTHHVMTLELFYSLRQLGREKECLALIARHDRLYPKVKLMDFRPWVLMKLHRYQEANALAMRFLKQKKYVMTSLNALCAIHFEQNHRKEALRYCQMAYKLDAKRKTRSNRSVHLINLAEAHLSLYDFNQAEKYALGATKHFHRFLHSTPWEFLVGLYLDLGRYNDAWNALRQSHQWYMQQAPRLSESVYAGNQMTKSVFFLAMGNPKVAMQLLERIRDRPDRRGHMSADTRQFVVGERLLRYHARRLQIELLREKAPTVGWFPRWGLWLQRKWLGLQAWRDGASVRRALADQGFLQRSLSPYRSGSFSMPNSAVPFWMVGSVIPLVGPAVVKDAIAGVRQQEMKQSPRVRAFFLALEAEAAYRQGQQKEAQALVQSALQKIPPQLGPLRARLLVMDGVLARERGEWNGMKQAFAQVIRKDGSPFRLLNVPFPVVSVSATAGDATRLAKMLFASPRFMLHHAGFKLQVERTGQWMRATLLDDLGSVMHRFKLTRNKKESEKAFLRRFVVTFQSDLFSPHFQLSRRQIFSLDDSLLRSSRETMIMKKSDLLPPEERKPADR